jgi:alpha-N-arabinofuranosidase
MATLGAASAFAADGLDVSLVVHADQPGAVINPNLYGQFSEHLGHCIYGGIWVGPDSPIPNTRGIRNDVIAALRGLHVPVLRWPGGCFADEYHWRDGIGPRDKRPTKVNTSWGGVVEDNSFGTHEFLDLCGLIGAEPYICGNVGSGTVQEMADWIEYMTSDANSPMANLRRANGREKPWKIRYFGVGNESWGCGGNMRPEFYADNFKRYGTFVKDFSGNHVYQIASGSNASDTNWTEVLMGEAARRMNGLSLHYYTLPHNNWKEKGSATGFTEADWFATMKGTLRMDEIIAHHAAIMDKFDPDRKVGLVVDEWGVWTDVEPGTNPAFLYQQNSLRDALVAALNLHIFQRHTDRVVMANIAQMVNVLQSMILTDNEKMLLTPTYHVFEMLNVHQGATVLPLELTTPDYVFGPDKIPAVSASASRDSSGHVHISLVNVDPHHDAHLICHLVGLATKSVSGRVLTAAAINTCNTFAAPHAVEPAAFTGAQFAAGNLSVDLPAKSVVILQLD